MSATKIDWTDVVWNPVRGCSRVSPGCDNCYAMRQARRFDVPGGPYEGLTRIGKRGVDWSGRLVLDAKQLHRPLGWKKPRRIFVNSMSDLFHESLEDDAVDAVLSIVARCPQHTFQVLTKRAERMFRYFRNPLWGGATLLQGRRGFMLPNLHLGVSAEDRLALAARLPLLMKTLASVRFLSLEPLLGPVFLEDAHHELVNCFVRPDARMLVDWVIVGGESGPKARPCDGSWIRDVVRDCNKLDIPCFVKQLGAHYCDPKNGIGGARARPPSDLKISIRKLAHPKGGDPSEWPSDLRVREYPKEIRTP